MIELNTKNHVDKKVQIYVRANAWNNVRENVWENAKDNVWRNVRDNVWKNVLNSVTYNVWLYLENHTKQI